MKQKNQKQRRAERLAAVSRKVRKESMQVNAEFAAIEQDPDTSTRRHLAGESRLGTANH